MTTEKQIIKKEVDINGLKEHMHILAYTKFSEKYRLMDELLLHT